VSGLQTEYDFTLPRGYIDAQGTLHRHGTMRLATARDELEPLRDTRITGPDDPLLTVIVLSRVITRLGTLRQVTPSDIQDLFAVDLAFLQDFYGVINFGSEQEIADLLASQLEPTRAEPPGPAPDQGPVDDSAGQPPRNAGAGRRGAIEEVRDPA
jgi:hypothetical protein